ncbi:MAG: hybrid sensor histidine kinase/response regulator [Gemmatimonadales bacterium]|nr:MAG: hybrid sensor histidine kinase/response regulator [Gemmatimonadales bacterium]
MSFRRPSDAPRKGPTVAGVDEADLLAGLARAAATGDGARAFLRTAMRSLRGAVGSATLGIWMLADGRLHLKGYVPPEDGPSFDEEAFKELFGSLPITGNLPGHKVLRAARPLVWRSDSEDLPQEAAMVLDELSADGLVGVPIIVAGLPVGVALLTVDAREEAELLALGELLVTPLAIFAILYRNEQLREADAERALRLQTLALAVEASPDLILLMDGEGRIQVANPAARPLLGMDPDNLRGRSVGDLLVPAGGALAPDDLLRRIRGGHEDGPVEQDVHLRCRPSGTVVCRLSVVSVGSGSHRRAVGLFHDVTQDRRREAERLRNRKLQAVGRVASGIGHEVNTPLTTISHLAELLLEEGLPDPATDFALAIRQQVRQAATVIQNLQTFAREGELECSWVDVGVLLHSLLRGARSELDPAGIVPELDVAADTPRIWADSHQLRTVFQNLLANARTAMVRHSPMDQRSIRVTVDPLPDGGVQVVIRDSGPGLPEEILQDLFVPFTQTTPNDTSGEPSPTPADSTPNRGLGLSVSHGIVLRHGGSIDGENASDGGARFQVRLPAVASGASGPRADPSVLGTTDAPATARDSRILVVEDEPFLATAVARALQKWGWETVVAQRGEEAIEELESRPDGWAVIFSDFRMPGVGGRGLYEHVDRHRPDLRDRFVFTTGDLVDPATHDFVRASGRPVLMKPYELTELRALIRKVAGGTPG